MRLQQRFLRRETLLRGVASLELIESYPQDKYLPSYHLRGEREGQIFHAHIAADLDGRNVRVVTMYLPSPDEWDSEFRSRRSRE